MVGEELISREEAVARIDPGQLDQLLHPMIDPTPTSRSPRTGLNASPGPPRGAIVLDADTAEERGKAGDDVILVRWETTPDDIHGLIQARGVLTAHGGMTSHAAVVARGMGKPCVAGVRRALDRRRSAGTVTIGEHVLDGGDVITIDGGTGRVIVGPVRLVPPAIDENFGTILDWADELRRLRVRANADTPEDAAKAREFGAEGIGLCRTEHMFMAQDRLPIVQEMILARDETAPPRRARRLLADAAVRLRGDLRGDGRVPGHDPPARPAAARVPARARGRDLGRRCARRIARAARGEPDARDARLPARAAVARRSTRCRCARSFAPRRPWASARARRRSSRSCTRSSASREELAPPARADRAGRRGGAVRSSTSAAR